MVDRELEEKIKKTKEFMELWMKFHNLYKEALKKETIDPQEENAFLETKSLIARKYQALKDFLEMPPTFEEDKTFDVISQVLSLQGVSALSDVQIQEIETEWHRSYLVLNKILGTLENRKEALARIHPLSTLLPKIQKFFSGLWKPPLRKMAKTIVVLFLAYWVLIRMLQLDERLRIFLSGFSPFETLQNFFKSSAS